VDYSDSFETIIATLPDAVASATSLEASAQALLGAIRATMLGQHVVLGRVFVVTTAESLQPSQRTFASELATRVGHASSMRPSTPTLALAATIGREPAWNDRRQSRGHAAIPLLSMDFVQGIPMIARLTSTLGIRLEGLDANEPGFDVDSMGRVGGVFHVADAKNNRDESGRLIIPDQDFVTTHHVHAVIGAGGGYLATQILAVAILFLDSAIDARQARRFSGVMSAFRNQTMMYALDGKLWDIP